MVAVYIFMVRLHAHPVSSEIEVAIHPMKTVPTLVMTDDGGVSDIISLSWHRHSRLHHHAQYARGNPRYETPGSNDRGIFGLMLPSRSIAL